VTSLRGAWSGCTRAAIAAVQQVRTHDHCDVVAVHDQDAHAVATCRAATGIGNGTTSFDELLATGVDFVVLGGPLNVRLAQVEAAAAQAVHCLCTVPFASDVATAAAMTAVCERAQVKLGVLVPQLGDPLFDQVRRMIAADWLGGVVSVVSVSGDDERLRGNGEPALHPFVDRSASHVHVLSWLTGRAALRVTAQATRGYGRGDDSAVATAVLRGNIACSFTASHVTRGELLAIYGTDGAALVGTERAWLLGRSEFRGPVLDYVVPGHELLVSRAELEPRLRALTPAAEPLGRFARWLDDTDDFPCPAEQALADLRTIDAMLKALASGRTEEVTA
jgi:predicted dehydrogenase